MEQKRDSLTKLELQIMQVLWREGKCNVSAVQAGLEQKLAYTTVQTMLNILHKKGKLKRKLAGRAYEYYAVVSEEKASGSALRDLIDRMFGGSSEELVMTLVKSRHIDAKKIEELSKRLQQKEGDA